MSLKQRLLVLMLSAVVVVWLLAAALTYYDAQHEVNEVLDAHLIQTSALLMAQNLHDLEESGDDDQEDSKNDTKSPKATVLPTRQHVLELHKYTQQVAFQIWEDGDELLTYSANAPQVHLSRQWEGFSNQDQWRVFSTWDDRQQFLVQVAEHAELRAHVTASITENLTRPLWAALPFLALLLWFTVSISLRPLARLTQAIAKREPQNLTPLQLTAPKEVQPLIERLNHLFNRIERLIEQERRFTADAAHELRTPIAGIKAQVQVAQGANTALEREHALDYATQGCQHATHLIGQLLTLARLESSANVHFEPCELKALATEVLIDIAPDAHAAGKSVELIEGFEASVLGLPTLIQVLIRNLLDNALRYTPIGTHITIAIHHEPQPTLVISDNGLGLSEEEMAKITQRFYRVLGNEASGSGLGLSIVERIAEIHNAQVKFSKPALGSGLQVTIQFPALKAC